jgi:hyperosmotically inducible protein
MHRTHRVAFAFAIMLQLGCVGAMARTPDASADAQITEQIRTAIFKRPQLAGDDISVQTHDGVVYLHGVVDTNVERADVESLVAQTPGVKRVVNALELRNRTR